MKLNVFLLSAAAMVNAASGSDGSTVHLGTADDYVILAKTGISTVPTSKITGDIAVSPIAATAITGFSLVADSTTLFSKSTQVLGENKVYAACYGGQTAVDLTAAISDMETAYNEVALLVTSGGDFNAKYGKICVTSSNNCYDDDVDVLAYVNDNPDDFFNLGDGEIGDLKLIPGVYSFDKDVTIINGGGVTFVGGPTDIFIIQTTGSVLEAAGKRVTLDGGALAKNIFWQVAGEVTVEANAHMEGVLLAKTAVTFKTNSSLNGRILTQTAVALQIATITQPPV